MNRQLALFCDRKGRVVLVLVGTSLGISIPELGGQPGGGRLRGLRLLHTHLQEELINEEDLMDLLFLRLDVLAVLSVGMAGEPRTLQYAQLSAEKKDPPCDISKALPWDTQDVSLSEQTEALEATFTAKCPGREIHGLERAILVSVSVLPHAVQEKQLDELARLCKTAGIDPRARIIQRTARDNARHILGKGKIAELEVLALEHNATTLLFDGELTPAQLHNLADITERRVLDRTQLILDIFAQHAKSKAGKLQVELAQLRYLQPRLAGKNRAMDRLMGGIGGRGPGETRLETDRRRNRERISFLKRALEELADTRAHLRKRRKASGLPLVAIVGYTNAGKSTLLNTLSSSHVLAEDKLFATLDPVARRLRYPSSREILFTDTIGFIRNLPDELLEAFRATLDELQDADLLLHLVDAADENLEQHMASVREILGSLELGSLPTLLILNKWDRLSPAQQASLLAHYPEAIPISATTRCGLKELNEHILQRLFRNYTPKNQD